MKKFLVVFLTVIMVGAGLIGCRKLPGEVDNPGEYKFAAGKWTINDVKLWDTQKSFALTYGMYLEQVQEIYGEGQLLIEDGHVKIFDYPDHDMIRLYFRENRLARMVVNDFNGFRYATFRGIGVDATLEMIENAYGKALDEQNGAYTYIVRVSGKNAGELLFLPNAASGTTSIMIGDYGADLGEAIKKYTSERDKTGQ